MTAYGSGSAECRPLAFLPTGAPFAAPSLLLLLVCPQPTRDQCCCPRPLYPRESANHGSSHPLGRGLQNKANTADTRQFRSKVQAISGGNSNSHQSLSGLNIREARIQPKLSTRNCGALKETKGTWWQQAFLGLASDYPGQELANCHCCVAFSPRNEKIPGRLPSPCSCCDSAVSNTHGGWLKMGSAVSTGQFCPQAGCCPPSLQAEVSDCTT